MTKKLLWYFLLSSSLLSAQLPDSTPLQTTIDTLYVEYTYRLATFGVGHNGVSLGEEALQRYASTNLTTVLQLESSFFVKDYGVTGISTLSGRGGGAAHTNVLWEGFNLQSPMLGQADISLLPTIFIDQIDIQYGAESALFGNSSIGGSVHLQTNQKFNTGWSFLGNASIGSFQQLGQQMKLAFSNKWYSTSFRFFHKQGQNDFFFEDKNAFGTPKPIRKQTNARLQQTGGMMTHDFKLQQHTFGTKIWYQYSFRQIPPTLLQTTSEDTQTDMAWRATADWKWVGKQISWKARTALFAESLLFQNLGIDSRSQILSSRTELESTWYPLLSHRFNFGANYSYFTALSTGLAITPVQHRTALFLSYKFSPTDMPLQTVFHLREEVVNTQWTRPAVSLGTEWQFYKKWYLLAHLSHNYRLPTFNDLYWDVLGNPDLEPEYSWNSELGIHFPIYHKNITFKGGLTGFCNLVDNWILWSPNPQGLWRPDNIEQVWARGLELQLKASYRFSSGKISINTNYAYTQSTRTESTTSSLIGKQLIYTPVHNANIALAFQYKNTQILYQHSFTSSRYIDNLNTEILPFYQFAHLRLSQSLPIDKSTWRGYIQINNLYGADFQIISNRPMPWQQFEVGIQVDIQ
jgi:iron complex outermembrane receptor protein